MTFSFEKLFNFRFFRPKSDRSSKKFINIFKFSSTEQSQANLSEEEKRNRRDVMSKAAEERSQSWNKKYLSKDKSDKVSPPLIKESSITLDEPKEVDPTTLKSVEQAKKAEENLEKVSKSLVIIFVVNDINYFRSQFC